MVDQNESAEQQRKSTAFGLTWWKKAAGGGVRGVRKPQNCTEIRQKTANCIGFFSRIPKLHVHGGPL